MPQRCYFAHHVPEYGTEREADAIAVIEAAGYEVDNPNAPEHQEGYRQQGMEYFLGRVAACDALALQRFASGEIGAGVGKEVWRAVEEDLPVFEIIENRLVPVDGLYIADSAMSVDETRALIKRLMNTNYSSA